MSNRKGYVGMTANGYITKRKVVKCMTAIIKEDLHLEKGVKTSSVEMLLHHIANQAQSIERKLAMKINDEISQGFSENYNEVSKARIYMTSLQE